MITEPAPHPAETAALSLIAEGAPLAATLECLATLAESVADGARAVILVTDESGTSLRLGAAPSMPSEFGWAFDGLAIDGPGPCARAASAGRVVVSFDLDADVRQPENRAATMQELTTCWAVPVLSAKAPRTLAVLAVFFRDHRAMADADQAAVARIGQLIAVAIAHSRAESELARRASHDAGDSVLRAAAERLVRAMRPGDTVARVAGDEFVVLCEDVSGRHQAEGIASRLADVMARPFAVHGREVFLTTSIGIAIGVGKEPPELLLRDASSATQKAKENGRGRVELFDAEMGARVLARLETENAMRRAVERREFTLVYQPEVDLKDGAIRGVEALARWRHPELGIIDPLDFIPLAEETGLIVPIGTQLLHEACRQAAEWEAAVGDRPFAVWVNLSGRQLATIDVVELVQSALSAAGVSPARIGLEMTESVVMEDPESALAQLRELKRLGISLAIDDFGTGYSSLGYLKRFPIDILKIDRSFVSGLGRDADDASIVAAMVGLAHTLGMGVVAEGVESAVQAQVLTGLGCRQAQGFYYARPAPPDAIGELLQPTSRSVGTKRD